MRFTCVKCQTKYRIDQERIRNRVLRVRCRHCGTILKVRDPGLRPASLPGGEAVRKPAKQPSAGQSTDPAAADTLVTRVATPAGRGAASRPRRGDGSSGRDDLKTRPENTAPQQAGSDDGAAPASAPSPAQPPAAPPVETDQIVPDDGWYRVLDGKPEGPYRLNELVVQAVEGRLAGDDLVWQPEWTQWHPATDVDVLRAAFDAPPADPVEPASRGRAQTMQVGVTDIVERPGMTGEFASIAAGDGGAGLDLGRASRARGPVDDPFQPGQAPTTPSSPKQVASDEARASDAAKAAEATVGLGPSAPDPAGPATASGSGAVSATPRSSPVGEPAAASASAKGDAPSSMPGPDGSPASTKAGAVDSASDGEPKAEDTPRPGPLDDPLARLLQREAVGEGREASADDGEPGSAGSEAASPVADTDGRPSGGAPGEERPQLQVIAGGRPPGQAAAGPAAPGLTSEDELFSDDFFVGGAISGNDALDDDDLRSLEEEALELDRVLRTTPGAGGLRDLDFDIPTANEPLHANQSPSQVRKLQQEFSVMVRLGRQQTKRKWLFAVLAVGFFAALAFGLTQVGRKLERRAAPGPSRSADPSMVLHQTRYEVPKPAVRASPPQKLPLPKAKPAATPPPAPQPEATPAPAEPVRRAAAKKPRKPRKKKALSEQDEMRRKIELRDRLRAGQVLVKNDGKVERTPTLSTSLLGRTARPLSPDEVDKVMRANANKMASCKTSIAPQKITIRLTVGTSGLVDAVTVKFGGADDPEMAACLRRLMKKWIFTHELPKAQAFTRQIIL